MPPKSRPRKTASVEMQIRRLAHRMEGVSIRARAEPPPIVVRPWFNITVAFDITTLASPVAHTTGTIATQLASQLGLSSTDNFDMRIREVRAWGSLGGSLTLEVLDPTISTGHTLSKIDDVGSATSRPHAGYVFPSRVATFGINLGVSANPVANLSSSSSSTFSTNATVRYLCQFKLSDPDPPQKKRGPVGSAPRPSSEFEPQLSKRF